MTVRTFGLLMPMPKAMVAAMMGVLSWMKFSWMFARSSFERPA